MEHQAIGKHMISRSEFLKASIGAVAVASVAGCDLLSTEAANRGDSGPPGKGGTRGSEAPMLATLVEQGDLEPVGERLPESPAVVEPVERTGIYGGTWHTALVGAEDDAWLRRTIGYDNLFRYNREWTDVIPNLAESVDAGSDGSVYTVKLRKGTRWSDGEPFTADDILFWYDDVFMNEEITPTPDPMYTAGGRPMVVEKVDETTVTFRFEAPNGLFLDYLGSGAGSEPNSYPRHYLTQFHKDHNPDEIDQLVEEAGFDDWVALFGAKADVWTNAERPTLHAWRLTTAYGASTTRVTATRNPYYWKVDPDGRQLPYIDEVTYDIANDFEVVLLKTQNGEIDLHARHINTLINKPILAQSREAGDYDFFDLVPDPINSAMIALNLTHTDPAKRAMFQNKDFRIGLFHAINRQEIIDTIYKGQGEPWQASPRQSTEFYNETLAKQYVEYDVNLANEYLDRAGYAARDGQNRRLDADGNLVAITAEVTGEEGPEWPDLMELVAQYWREVGIDARTQNMTDRSSRSAETRASKMSR